MNILFLTLTFIIMIVVILSVDSIATAVIIISLLANFLIISTHFGNISKNILEIASAPAKGPPSGNAPVAVEPAPPSELAEPSTDLYGPDYEQWRAYSNSYSLYDEPRPVVGFSCGERTHSVDSANAYMAQRRARDKKCSDGWAMRDANYFKYHYGAELDEAENKVWWGRFDH